MSKRADARAQELTEWIAFLERQRAHTLRIADELSKSIDTHRAELEEVIIGRKTFK